MLCHSCPCLSPHPQGRKRAPVAVFCNVGAVLTSEWLGGFICTSSGSSKILFKLLYSVLPAVIWQLAEACSRGGESSRVDNGIQSNNDHDKKNQH